MPLVFDISDPAFLSAGLPHMPTVSEAMDDFPGLIGCFRAAYEPAGTEATAWIPLAGDYSLSGNNAAQRPVHDVADGLQVLRFEGGDDMVYSPNGSIDEAAEITFGIRLRINSTSGTQILTGDSSNNFRVDITGGMLRFYTGGTSASYITAPISALGWHTIICTHSNATSRIDIDGNVTSGAGAGLNAGLSHVLGAWAGGTSMQADVRSVVVAASDSYGTEHYDTVRKFLAG